MLYVSFCYLIRWFKNGLKVKPFWNLYYKMFKLYIGEKLKKKNQTKNFI